MIWYNGAESEVTLGIGRKTCLQNGQENNIFSVMEFNIQNVIFLSFTFFIGFPSKKRQKTENKEEKRPAQRCQRLIFFLHFSMNKQEVWPCYLRKNCLLVCRPRHLSLHVARIFTERYGDCLLLRKLCLSPVNLSSPLLFITEGNLQ